MRQFRATVVSAAMLLGLTACAADDPAADSVDDEPETREIALGPVDGHDLPGTDLERVASGDLAPDFIAMSLSGEPVTLSQYRGKKNVVLFFYRGHW